MYLTLYGIAIEQECARVFQEEDGKQMHIILQPYPVLNSGSDTRILLT